MLELPQSISPSKLMNYSISGKCIRNIIAIPNSRLRFYGESKEYSKLLTDKTIRKVTSLGGLLQIQAGKILLLFGNGVELRYYKTSNAMPAIHPFVIQFHDGSSLAASTELYGAIWCFHEDDLYHPYLGAQT